MGFEGVPAVMHDGFLRIPLDELLSIPLAHLVSGLDEEEPHDLQRCGAVTSIEGYTEWVSEDTQTPISLGWDWRLDRLGNGEVTCVRVGLPRSNVMLVDGSNQDYGWDRNLRALASVVDALSWSEQTRSAVDRS
ncbi:MAG: DUF4902 domain-containing protein [Alcaligenes sp.]